MGYRVERAIRIRAERDRLDHRWPVAQLVHLRTRQHEPHRSLKRAGGTWTATTPGVRAGTASGKAEAPASELGRLWVTVQGYVQRDTVVQALLHEPNPQTVHEPGWPHTVSHARGMLVP